MIESVRNLFLKHKGMFALLFCGSFFTWYVIQSVFFLPHDYSNSYFGSLFFLNGKFDSQLFDPYTFNRMIYDEGFRNVFVSFSPNPPSTALFFIPFALLPLTLSKLVFNVLSCLLLFISVYRLSKHLGVDAAIIFMLIPFLLFIPVRNHILFGQSYFLVFFLLAEGYLAYDSGKNFLAALLWSCAVFIKIFPIIIFLFLLIKNDWRTALKMASVCLALLIFFILIQGVGIWKIYATEILPRSSRGEISWAFITAYQSVQMLCKYFFVYDERLNPNPLVDSRFLYESFQILFKALILTLCSAVIATRKDLLSFGLLLLGGVLISAYGSTYVNILLLFILMPAYKVFQRKHFVMIAFLIFLISNLPISYFKSLPIILQFPRLIVMTLLLLMVYYFAKARFRWEVAIIYSIVLAIPALPRFQNEHDPSKVLLNEERHSIIFDYFVDNGYIVYRYWDEKGEHIHRTEVPAVTPSTESIELRNNQIFYKNKVLTFTADNKMKPAIVDSDKVVYLSDKERGFGFYNLRVIHLNDKLMD